MINPFKTLWTDTCFLTLLFMESFITRALFFLYFTQHGSNAWIPVDSDQYLTIAHNIAIGNGVCMEPEVAPYYRLPGYSLFLVLCNKICSLSLQNSLWMQIVIASTIPLLVFYLGHSLFPNHKIIARIASVIASLHLGLVLYAGMIATETLTVFFLLIFFIMFIRLFKNASHPVLTNNSVRLLALSAGAALGMASLIRPVGHYVLICSLGMIFLWFGWNKKMVRSMACVILGWSIMIGPWIIRNFLLTGALFFHSLPGLHFLQYTAAHIVMQEQRCSYPQARSTVLTEWSKKIQAIEVQTQSKLNDYKQCCIGQTLASHYVYKHPLFALKYALEELCKTCVGLYSAVILLGDNGTWPDYEKDPSWTNKIKRFLSPNVKRSLLIPLIYWEIVLMLIILFGLGLFFMHALFEKRLWEIVYTTVPFIALFVIITVAYGGARFRLLCEPFLILLATTGWLLTLQKEKYLKSL